MNWRKLSCTNHIFFDVEVLDRLPGLQETPPETHFDESIKYCWQLLEYLLGRRESMSRSFEYSFDESSPIGKNEVLDHVTKVLAGTIDHVRCIGLQVHRKLCSGKWNRLTIKDGFQRQVLGSLTVQHLSS
ncbi:hypothetical protein RvY_07455-1 [Ramazzottius varieornatus]|uniref:Uncharacterized protein n=1 Tax=Ramazzottius varieornatus TaxID=947166 RepID=A0A1D1VBQ9_RAMVA|nr:hypothetical protein RvY_07455-1 [Ramazzottius varieornatus]